MFKIARIPCAYEKQGQIEQFYKNNSITHNGHLVSFISIKELIGHTSVLKKVCHKNGIKLYHVMSCDITYTKIVGKEQNEYVWYADIVHNTYDKDNKYIMIEYQTIKQCRDSTSYLALLNCIRICNSINNH